MNEAQWRLILDDECEPYWNMAADSAILDAVIQGAVPPTIRFYRWDSPAVTVGRFQDVNRGIDVAQCQERGIPIVRRPTGGRGILHGGDQTVSIVVPESVLGSAAISVAASYRTLSEGFIAGLRLLGLRVELGACEPVAGSAGDCFATRSRADVIVAYDGSKLIGSAQRRKLGVILQQSSLRHFPAPMSATEVFLGPTSESSYPLAAVSTLELRDALSGGFREALGIQLATAPMSGAEIAESRAICQTLRVAYTSSTLVDSGRTI